MTTARRWKALGIALLLGLLAAPQAKAEPGQGAIAETSLRGFTSLAAGYTNPPANAPMATSTREFLWNIDQRLLAEAHPSTSLSLAANLLQNLRFGSPGTTGSSPAGETERSSLLAWRQHQDGDTTAALAADSLNARWQSGDTELTIGRQPISLATTFFFSPNDFFAPFGAQTFYRVYKPGVDAVRSETRLANLSQLTLLGVLGYAPDPTSGNGWSNGPEWSRASLLARITREQDGFAWGALLGTVREHRVAGGSLSGELFDWLGVRMEGHYADPEQDGIAGGMELSLGVEHRFGNSLFLRLEQFLHGQGYASVAEINGDLARGQLRNGLLGRNYSGFGAGYEFSPLTTGECIALTSWSDHSGLISATLVRSLSDETELAATFTLPFGAGPEPGSIGSEFGQAGTTVMLEFRAYY